jgi:flagellar biosynthesis/type III secretory pathway protein FliH
VSEPRRPPRVLDAPPHVERPFTPRGTTADASPEAALARAREQARSDGYREGRERAAAELARELEALRDALAEALRRAAELEQRWTREHEARLAELALEAASRIARRRIEAGDPVAADAIREALGELPDPTSFRARVHPDELTSVAERLRAEIDAGRLELVGDASVSRGGAALEMAAGRVDATVETAERAVREAVFGSGDEA